MIARRVCATCGKHLGWKEVAGDHAITHGICTECERKAYAELARMTLDGTARLVT